MDIENNKYKYIMIYLFFEKNYTNLFLSDKKLTKSDFVDNMQNFIDFIKKMINFKKNISSSSNYLQKYYYTNDFIKNIINMYITNFHDFLKIIYIDELIKKYKVDNKINILENFKIFKIHINEHFKKDSVKIKKTNIEINLHHEFNKYHIGCNEFFSQYVNKYYDLEFLDNEVLFEIFKNTKEFNTYVKQLIDLVYDVVYPKFQNSI